MNLLTPIICSLALNIGKEASKKSHNPFIIEIINGSKASFGEFPFIVSLQNKSTETETHFCGGSIFNPRTIITAAHCIEYYDESMIRVVAGTLNIYDMGENAQVRNVTQKILHPEFRQPTYMDNDIGMKFWAFLTKSFKLNNVKNQLFL